MTNNAEPIDVCACVDAIVARYNDAAAIIQRVKASRADKQAPAPSRYLEETIQCAPEDILKERSVDSTLRGLNNALQTGLLQELQRLAHTEELVDFRQLVDDADAGRDQAVDTLIRLRQRCLVAEATEVPSRHSSDASIRSKDLPSPPTETTKTYHFPQHHNPWLRLHNRSNTNVDLRHVSNEEDAHSGAETPLKKHGHGSLLHFLKHHRAHSHGDKSGEHNPEESRRAHRASVFTSTDQNRSVSSLGGPEGPWWSNDNREPVQRQSSDLVHRDSTVSVDTVVGVSPMTMRARGRTASTATGYLRNPSLAVPTPSQDNDYLGFCKGAVRMQNGDKRAMEKRKEFNDGWSQATVYYLACSTRQCTFAAHIDINIVMTKVFTVEAKGLSFRWPFLAKSHVVQQKTKDNSHAFQCLFCVFTGEKAEVFQGNDAYLDHVSMHRGDIGAVTLYKTRCINDHVAGASEEFDINLFPLSYDGSNSRRASEMLADDLTAMHLSTYSTGKNDSVLETDEPWNKGLSEFHYRDEFERGEIG
ncbi:hypothetical protein AMS68_005988 [Peltaster fructicola]|uniref:Uncharacterized protein n=1 Tax=Peltaster fructicola TaxID=286661 RepID=A0A6H0Y0M2_9PEZI|nr:hypothetical protein AMS68_005988 [Peltaster fructicola]